MRSRFAMVVAIAGALAAVAFTIFKVAAVPRPLPPAHASLPPKLVSYLGVFENGAPPSYQPLDEFARVTGRNPNLVGYYSGWVQGFDLPFANSVRAHGSTPLVQIDPLYSTVAGIASGIYDGYLREYADSVRRFRHAVVIGFGHEMNAAWYPWGYRHVKPATFRAAWRHIVDVFRAQGAGNVTWLWTVNALRPAGAPAAAGGIGPLSRWWPGAAYVDWVGIDGFFYRRGSTFKTVFSPTIRQVRQLTRRPILLSETAVAPGVGQFYRIRDLFTGMVKSKMLGLVWFDNTQNKGLYHQDWRIEDNQLAELSFRYNVRQDLKAPPRT